jgi:hypothetical protein
MGFLPLFIKWFTHTLKIYKKILSGKRFVGAETYYFYMTREDLQTLMLKQVATKINNVTRGTTKRRILHPNVIYLALERASRRRKFKNYK